MAACSGTTTATECQNTGWYDGGISRLSRSQNAAAQAIAAATMSCNTARAVRVWVFTDQRGSALRGARLSTMNIRQA